MRGSVRSYNGQPLTAEQETELKQYIAQSTSPFEGGVTIRLATVGDGSDFHPSTYGVIKGARSFFMVSAQDTDSAWLSAGYQMERLVLNANAMKLGTCWITGTFDKGTFTEAAQTPKDQKLIAVVSVGAPADSRSFMDKIFHHFAKGGKRQPFGSMFFMNNFNTPLPSDGQFATPLELMRWAPSAMNKQPWRALVRGNQVDFYYKGSGRAPVLDMGIGLCHFDLACQAQHVNGMFAKNNMAVDAPDDWSYIISYIQA